MNSAWQYVAAASLGVLCATNQADAQTRSVVGVNSIAVPSGDAQWLADWYSMHEKRSGTVFNPRVDVTSLSGLSALFAVNPSAVALVPSSVAIGSTPEDYFRSETGVSVCLTIIVDRDGPVQSLGDLHAVEGQPRIAVPGDIRHLVERSLSLYGLQDRVEWVETDNEGSVAATGSGDAHIGFLSASADRAPAILGSHGDSIALAPVPPVVLEMGKDDGLFATDLPLAEAGLFETAPLYTSLCDPIDAVTTKVSRYSKTNFLADDARDASPENAGLFARAYDALNRLLTINH